MSLVSASLGNGRYEIVEDDSFTRILNNQFWDDEEVRYDMPDSLINAWAYIAVASSGSSVIDTVWSCVRRSYDGRGKVYRDQFRNHIAWTERANGWT